MAISDSYDFNMTRNDIIQDALENIGVLGEGFPMNTDHIYKGARKLNMLVQQMGSQADFGYGRKIWARKRGYLFLQKGQVDYVLGPAATDDHWTNEYVKTTLTAAVAGSGTSLTVDSIVGFTSADKIGILLADGTLHWDVINGAPSGSTIVITTGLASNALNGARVFAYTSRAQRPQRFLAAVRRNTDGEDSTMDEIINVEDYEAITDKTAEGLPIAYLSEPMVDNVRILIDAAPEDITDVIRFTYHRPLADFDATTDTPDFPKIWYRYITAQLAIDLAPSYGRQVSQELKITRDEASEIARHEYAEEKIVFFEPDKVD